MSQRVDRILELARLINWEEYEERFPQAAYAMVGSMEKIFDNQKRLELSRINAAGDIK